MEENSCSTILDGEVVGIRFALASHQEISIASISDCPISHASQLANPFLGLPLEFGKCESCGTSEPGKCEGHFGYIELPIPIYHPSHITELKRMFSLLCLKCLKMKKNKFPNKNTGVAERLLSSCCEDVPQYSLKEVNMTDGACYLQLKAPSRRLRDGIWNFLERYGFRYGHDFTRTLLPCEVMEILKRIPVETKRKLSGKGYFPQDGYILQYLPVPPNCLSVPEISDGVSIMSSDPSIATLKKILKQVEIIKSSRSGAPNFESHEVEANDLQASVNLYLQLRGTGKASRDIDTRFGIRKESNDSSTKAWLDKIRTLFIKKGSGFSSRSVITGDAYIKVNEIGIPYEIAQRMTFEEKVNLHNIKYLQELVDNKLCLTYRDGSSTYSLREGSKGHTFLRMGQIVHRRIMDGDIVFINRPPTTHKHSLQALRVYVHDDHTVKINPLICGPLSADFDGDCIHLFYPQSLAAKAEVLELFSVEKQLLSSHSGNLNLQLATDSLLSLKMMFKTYFLDKATTQQLAMFVSSSLPWPALMKTDRAGPHWTALQVLQTALPSEFDCCGDRYLIRQSEVLKIDFNRDVLPNIINEIVAYIFFGRGPEEVLSFFNSLQPLLMENLFTEGFSVGLDDFSLSKDSIQTIQKNIQVISPLLFHLRSTYNELVELQLENHIRASKLPVTNFILMSSALGYLIDSKSDSAIHKIVQQIGFLGLQLSDKGKFYSKTLIEDVASLFHSKYLSDTVDYPSAEYGLIKSCFFHGLDPYEEMVHSISTREVIVRSSRGLSEPGTLFKNLMAILRDVVICYDGTVRNFCSNSIIQFEYGMKAGPNTYNLFPPGEPVGVLAATAMSTPAYKAVLDSSPSSNSSWELMKEILLCKASFKDDLIDRRVILYLNNCGCGRKHCHENAAYVVKNHLKKVSLKDTAVDFLIEYREPRSFSGNSEIDAGLAGHVHLNQMLLKELNVSMNEVLQKCQETVISYRKKKKIGPLFKMIDLSVSDCCSFHQSPNPRTADTPCLMLFWQDASHVHLERISKILADIICPVLLETIIKGDPRISAANIIWISPDSTSWIRNPCGSKKGELALDIVLEKSVVKQSGDAWRIVLDSCLPVLHLIDTKRSIPYAVKQVQELLGISCAFDQAVQRLGASVTMVAKGVLKDHLILLASSMTCAGNLIGFNSGGYKALSRSLNIQVPLTEATLFTPRKCFERAAEKCHTDTLSSIVASCAWGKHVAVGTGSKFDILWDKKEVDLDQQDGIDVYNFLLMVRGGANANESTSACLAEIDDLLDDENSDLKLSPDPYSTSDKMVFEDDVEFQNTSKTKEDTSSFGGWDKKTTTGQSTNDNDWSNWGKKNEDKQDVISEMEENASGWDKKTTKPSSGNVVKETTKPSSWSSWATDKAEAQDTSSTKAQEDSKYNGWGVKSSWGATDETEKSNWSGQRMNEAESHDVLSAQAKEDTSRSNGWDSVAPWNKTKDADESWPRRNDGQPLLDKGYDSCAWNSKVTEKRENQTTFGWVSSTAEDWNKDEHSHEVLDHVDSPKQGWGSQKESKHSWGQQKQKLEISQAWGCQKEPNLTEIERQPISVPQDRGAKDESNRSWGQKNSMESAQRWGVQNESKAQGWGSQNESNGTGEHQKSPEVSQTWSSQNDSNQSSSQQKSPASQVGGFQNESSSGEQQKSPIVSDGWGSQLQESNQSVNLQGWDCPTAGGNNESERHQWGAQKGGGSFKKNRTEGSQGWGSNAPEWKNRKNRLPKSPGVFNVDDSNMAGIYTATRQRLDMFTTEEQDVLADVESIMQSIRRIMHQSGYKDGDPVSADDQSFVLDKVFNYHPDKALKMGAGVDHVTVDRHSRFPESRCFYVVLMDGRKEDFSYIKCLGNFIKGKYPTIAETFISKYFRNRSGGNREQTPVPVETPPQS